MSKVVALRRRKPRVYTSAERVLDEVREWIYKDGRTMQKIADATGVSVSTIHAIGSGKTQWPRHTTLFPLLQALHLRIDIVSERNR
jgi:transcriptional regulator with XRE-family HTH domain